MSPRGPSWALKSLFKNLKKHQVFTRFWVQRPPKRASRNPRAAQEAPKELQRPEKNLPNKIPKNASVVKNALSWRSHFLLILGPRFGDFFCSFLSSLLIYFLITVWNFSNPILEAMVDKNRPKKEANDSKQPSKASKTPKAAFSKKHLKNMSCSLFLTTKASQECL